MVFEKDLENIVVSSVLNFDSIVVDIGLQLRPVKNALDEGIALAMTASGENRNLARPSICRRVQTPTKRYFLILSRNSVKR